MDAAFRWDGEITADKPIPFQRPPIRDAMGNLYGTILNGGGAWDCGAVFRLSPRGKETVLHTFAGGTDGALPGAGRDLGCGGQSLWNHGHPLLWGYFEFAHDPTHALANSAEKRDEERRSKTYTPFPVMVAKGTLHCGSGCVLGDVCAEWLAFVAPAVALWFGWRSFLGEKTGAKYYVPKLESDIAFKASLHRTLAVCEKPSLREAMQSWLA